MKFETSCVQEGLPTLFTTVWFLSLVNAPVYLEFKGLDECLSTVLAAVQSACLMVGVQVTSETTSMCEGLFTQLTVEPHFSNVNVLVYFKFI